VKLEKYIRSIPDFPVPGILFRDITPLLADPAALTAAVDQMADPWRGKGVKVLATMEARGFVFGGAMACQLGAGFVPVRKAGKLPFRTLSVEYSLEYRTDVLYIHEDSIRRGQKVLVVDDVIATGGTAKAVVELVEMLGGQVVGAQFLIELVDLRGRELLSGIEVQSLIKFEGD